MSRAMGLYIYQQNLTKKNVIRLEKSLVLASTNNENVIPIIKLPHMRADVRTSMVV